MVLSVPFIGLWSALPPTVDRMRRVSDAFHAADTATRGAYSTGLASNPVTSQSEQTRTRSGAASTHACAGAGEQTSFDRSTSRMTGVWPRSPRLWRTYHVDLSRHANDTVWPSRLFGRRDADSCQPPILTNTAGSGATGVFVRAPTVALSRREQQNNVESLSRLLALSGPSAFAVVGELARSHSLWMSS